MMPLRKIGKVLRGKATRFQVVSACVLGALLGFVPGFLLPSDLGGGFLQAPGLVLCLVAALLVLNANLAVFGLALLVSKAAALALLPVSFQVGVFLLDGPVRPLMAVLAGAPVLAWFGLGGYATTGGLLLGAAFGVLMGWLAVLGLAGFRARMGRLEEGSPAFQAFARRWYVRLAAWIFLGPAKKGGMTWREVLERQRTGSPVRVVGVAAVVLMAALLLAAQVVLGPGFLTPAARSGIEGVHGATVDLEHAGVSLLGGGASLAGLAMADPQDLEKDFLRVGRAEAAVDTGALLRRRLVVDRLVSSHVATGVPRAEPGRLLEPPEPPPEPEPDPDPWTFSLEECLEQAKLWKERLDMAVRVLGRLGFGGEEEPDPEEDPEVRRALRERELRLAGMAGAKARGLVAKAPSVLVREILLEGLPVAALGDDLLDVRVENLSSQPRRVAEPARLLARTASGNMRFALAILEGGRGGGTLEVALAGYPADRIARGLASRDGKPLLQGGTVDVAARGSLVPRAGGGFVVDLPLEVTLRGSTLHLAGLGETRLDHLTFPMQVRGSLTSPRVRLDLGAFGDALAAAGREELARQVRQRAVRLLGERLPSGLGGEAARILEEAKTPAEALEAARRAAEEEARRKIEEERKAAEEEARRRLQEELRRRLRGGGGQGGGG